MDIESLRDEEIEKVILSGLLKQEGYLKANDYKLNIDDFYLTKHKVIFQAIKKTFDDSGNVDLITVIDTLKNTNQLEKVTISYMTDLDTKFISLSNFGEYLERLKKYSKKRRLYDLSKFISNNLDKPVEELQEQTSKLIVDSLEEDSQEETNESQNEDFIKYLEEIEKGNCKIVKSYLTNLDRIIGGFYEGNLVTIFSFSNVGKTSFMLQLALNNIRMNKKTLVFSLEMSKNEIRGRMITNLTNIPYQKLMYSGEKTPEELETILNASDKLTSGLCVSNEDNLNNIVTKIQLEVLKNKIDVVFIDYIDLITLDKDKGEEYKKNIEVTRTLKRLALKLKVPIVILAQCKQEVASKMQNENLSLNEKVSVNDVYGGSSIFRDSDIVLGLYRNVDLDNEDVRRNKANEGKIDYNSPLADKNPEVMNVLVKKTRASGKGMIACKYEGNMFRISNFR